jgi:hypothetical protein
MDFSDGPYSMYALQINPGYALSEYVEIYANFAPFFISNPRAIVGKVQQLRLEGGETATITFSRPKMQYGGEIFWFPPMEKTASLAT